MLAYQWLQANPVFAVAALVIALLSVYRLAVRGRWLVILAIVLGWVFIGAVVWLVR